MSFLMASLMLIQPHAHLAPDPLPRTPNPSPVQEPTVQVLPTRVVADDGSIWAALRECESGGDYSTNTGNGYFGAYQFLLSTWQGLGYSGYPHEASPAIQDQAARELQARSGWGQWPSCAAQLGLI